MQFTSGQRITVRGEDFFVSNVSESDNGFILSVEGISELVKGKRFVFDTSIDNDIIPVDPTTTTFVKDDFPGYKRTKLYIETRKRTAPVNSNKIAIAHKAVFDVADYQLTPTLKALQLPRPRILIADAVGLGKTIEAGALLAELMKRGKGKRIMVLALKSILAQFQQEMWNRFAIPLVRLDSYGIAQLKTQLPANKNPFDYYDKTIVSIDTLKNNAKFRHYIEKSHWDVIVIDECHTVSNIDSMRGNLADFLSRKCESLILLSATPHNGKKESFANLINMIDPVAIPRNGNYTKQDVEPYYVRRFKTDIADQNVQKNFKDRKIIYLSPELTEDETAFLKYQQELKVDSLKALKNDKSKKDFLFSMMIFKAFMSSPLAAQRSLEARIKRVEETGGAGVTFEENQDILNKCLEMVSKVLSNDSDSKYLAFKDALEKSKWKGKKSDDRIVVFAERIDTLEYLKERLQKDFDLKDEVIATFSGSGMSDTEQQNMIEDFGKEDSIVRILLCSDAGSQGVNLHYYCHRMFNYDIPWSIITLDQRNGRIDRYGQKETPEITYIIGKSNDKEIRTDLSIIENVAKKEEEVYKTLGDAASVLREYDPKKEEQIIEKKIANNDTSELAAEENDPYAWGEDDTTEATITDEPLQSDFSIYAEEREYFKDLFNYLEHEKAIKSSEYEFDNEDYLELKFTDELKDVLYNMPPEAKPNDNELFKLTTDKDKVQKAIDNARKKAGDWAEFQIMYDLHPAIKYFMTKMEANVPKGVAPAAKVGHLPLNSFWYVLQGQVSNNLGQSILNELFVVGIENGELTSMKLRDFIEQYRLKQDLVNQNIEEYELEILKNDLPRVVMFASEHYMDPIQDRLATDKLEELTKHKKLLTEWRKISERQLEIEFKDKVETVAMKRKKERSFDEIESIANDQSRYMKDLFELDKEPYIQVIAAFYNK
jgi:ERCC4-related helicase